MIISVMIMTIFVIMVTISVMVMTHLCDDEDYVSANDGHLCDNDHHL